MQFSDKYSCVFVHIPKAGGSSVEQSSLFHDRRKSLGHYVGGHASIVQFQSTLGDRFDRYFKFTVCRNPYTRLYSAYNFLLDGGINPQDSKVFDLFADRDARSDFNYFVGSLTSTFIDNCLHMKTQASFVLDLHENVKLDYIAKLESYEEDMSYIFKKLGCPKDIRHVNRGSKPNLPVSEIYTKSSKNVVRNLYGIDFDVFGYDRNFC